MTRQRTENDSAFVEGESLFLLLQGVDRLPSRGKPIPESNRMMVSIGTVYPGHGDPPRRLPRRLRKCAPARG